MSIAVQCIGIDAVVKAFEYKKTPAWSIFQGRALLHKHEGKDLDESADTLQEFLQMISSGSTAIYTLKVYENVEKITEKTGCDGSINFRLVNEDTRQRTNEYFDNGRNKLLERLEAIEEKLNEDAEPEEPQSALGQLGNILLADPSKLPQLVSSLLSTLSLILPGVKQQPPPQMQPVYMPAPQQVPQTVYPIANDYNLPAGAIGNIEGTQKTTFAVNGAGESDPLLQAIETLKRNDPKIAEHLGKLANMSETNKETFNYLLNILDSM
jgi:hypothetical protein